MRTRVILVDDVIVTIKSVEELMDFVKISHLSKVWLAEQLKPESRQAFLGICAVLEKEATDECGSSGDTCLTDGCAFEGTDEVCLNAVLLSEKKCRKSCIDAWIEMFKNSDNRMDEWKN